MRADGTTPWEDGFSHNDLSYLYWPVSNLADEPYARETLVSNVAFDIHHTRLNASQHAVRVRTFPPSNPLNSFEDNIAFGIFMESNVDTNVSISTALGDDENVVTFEPQIGHFELGSTYTFDYSDYHDTGSIQLIRYDDNGNAITLSSPDSATGVMTVTLTDPDLVGKTVYVTKDQSITAHMTSTVRDGSVRRLYKEYPPAPFSDLFGDGFQTRVLECAIDPTYDRYDVFVTMRNGNERYITSHAFAHTVDPQGDYPSPQSIAIHSVEKTQPNNTVSFEYPSGYFVGLHFRVKEVGLKDMYQFILYPN
jgi:hypothetical protein